MNEYESKIYLKDSIIQDNTISDNGVLVYCYLREIHKSNRSQYYVSIGSMSFFFNHIIGISTKRKKRYIDGLNDLENHGLIKMKSSNVNDYIYDLSKVKITSTDSNTTIETADINKIMQINDSEYMPDKVKLLRYFVTASSLLKDCNSNTETVESLAFKSGISENTVPIYNKLLKKYDLLHMGKVNVIKYAR